MKNTILENIEKTALINNSKFDISGSKKTKIFYYKALENPYKIISCGNNKPLFQFVMAKLTQDKEKCTFYSKTLSGYFAIYSDENFKLEIEHNFNGYDTICVFKK